MKTRKRKKCRPTSTKHRSNVISEERRLAAERIASSSQMAEMMRNNRWPIRKQTAIPLMLLFTAFICISVLYQQQGPPPRWVVKVSFIWSKMMYWMFDGRYDCGVVDKNNDDYLYLTGTKRGRLGNQMFEYAGLLGIAAENNRIPLLDKEFYELEDYFIISLTPCYWKPDDSGLIWEDVTEVEITTRALKSLPNRNISLNGLFQSFRYFESISNQIRKEFTFQPHVAENAKALLHSLAPDAWKNQDFVRVGIHIRRGDVLNWMNSHVGYVDFKVDYFDRAMSYFTNTHSRVQFFVSGDVAWAERHLKAQSDKAVVSFLHDNTAIVDMALLVSCDHVIITQGTFGWWVAWLNRGTKVYSKDYPREHSPLAKMQKHGYYFPLEDSWIEL